MKKIENITPEDPICSGMCSYSYTGWNQRTGDQGNDRSDRRNGWR